MNFANKISTFRILSVPFFIACVIYYSPQREYLRFAALFIFALGVISDAVDGYIARKSKQYSKAGLVLDPLGDKLLLMSAFIFLSLKSEFPIRFPLGVVFIVISRDVIILLGALVIYIVKQEINISPTRLGKLTTTFQMFSVIAVLLQMRPAPVLWWIAVLFTLISGSDYVRRGFKTLYALDNSRNNH
ncbi:MAG: CDP-alcohol phosphatidyltransferase family protein [Candidatus Omnitrophica bacterium]|nr:CDP-alcohol phosphatidyltransferase family protein [Candidatus Omnitrophota bacterium]MDD5553567.1 CDP-alcohol phosphatidyltransferase family protein [Candidatus Omnitrophota bacterium]